MAKYVCPVCDRTMDSKHYCIHCKSWVKEPYTRKADYYLNERHPSEEVDCTYHTKDDASVHAQYGSGAGRMAGHVASERGIQPVYRPLEKDGIERSVSAMKKVSKRSFENAEELLRESGGREPEAGKKNPFMGIFVVLIIFLVFDFILPQLGNLLAYLGSFF